MKYLVRSFLLVLLIGSGVGCSTTGGFFDDPTARALTEVAFDVAVGELVKDGVDPQDIIDHVDALQDLLEGDAEATVSILTDVLLSRVDFTDMDPDRATAVRATISILAVRAEVEIEERGSAPEETQVVLSQVLDWIERSASIRLGSV